MASTTIALTKAIKLEAGKLNSHMNGAIEVNKKRLHNLKLKLTHMALDSNEYLLTQPLSDKQIAVVLEHREILLEVLSELV